MDAIINILCLKRLCMPSNTDINLLQNGVIKIPHNICKCDTSKHIAICLKENNTYNILSYGINMYDNKKKDGSSHAEINAINNLINSSANKKHLIKIDLLVIRTSNTGKLGMSKPCVKCLIDLSTLPKKKGYVLKNIYYSNSNGLIIKTNLKTLIETKEYHISRYYINNKFKYDF